MHTVIDIVCHRPFWWPTRLLRASSRVGKNVWLYRLGTGVGTYIGCRDMLHLQVLLLLLVVLSDYLDKLKIQR